MRTEELEQGGAMRCEEFEILLADHVDGTLDVLRRASFERHLRDCPGCAELARDVMGVVTVLETVPPIEAPPTLAARILFETASGKHGSLVPVPWWKKLLEPVLQPRFAMGMALTILSFSMLGRVAGVKPQQFTAEDLKPAGIWATMENRAHRTWDAVVKRYENLRVVYEIQTRMNEFTEQQEEERKARAAREAEKKGGAAAGTAKPEQGAEAAPAGKTETPQRESQ